MNRMTSSSISSESLPRDVVEKLQRVTVHVLAGRGSRGAGVVWGEDGLILTNAHVADGNAVVRLCDGRSFEAELVQRDPSADLAQLQIPASGLESAEIRDPQTLRPGEMVMAVGHPLGTDRAVSAGIVHAQSLDGWIEADVRLAPGNSGGPLADMTGRVVGINSMVVNGMGLAVSTTAIHKFLSQPSQTPHLGVRVTPVHTGNRGALGLLVTGLEPGGAAHLGGVLVGDVLLRAGGDALLSADRLRQAVLCSPDELQLEILRNGSPQRCRIPLRRNSQIMKGAV